jgi:hypothetical protein
MSPKSVVSPDCELAQFKSWSRRDIKISHWFNRHLAEVEASMIEPLVLAYGRNIRSQALIQLKLRFQGFHGSRKGPNISSCSVSSSVHIETIYSTDDLPAAYPKTDTSNPSNMYTRATSMQLPRCKSKITWSTASTSIRSESLQSSDDLQTWLTSINIPIQPPITLPPTFCSALAARTYLLRVSLKLNGASHKVFQLEAPLRVTYPSPRYTVFDYNETEANGRTYEQI